MGMMQEAIEDGGGAWDVTQKRSPVGDGPVGGHDGGAVFIAPEDDLKEQLAGASGELLDTHVVDDEQIGFELPGELAIFERSGLLVGQIADQIEDRAVIDAVARFEDA